MTIQQEGQKSRGGGYIHEEKKNGGPMCESSEPRPLPSPTNPRAKAARESTASRGGMQPPSVPLAPGSPRNDASVKASRGILAGLAKATVQETVQKTVQDKTTGQTKRTVGTSGIHAADTLTGRSPSPPGQHTTLFACCAVLPRYLGAHIVALRTAIAVFSFLVCLALGTSTACAPLILVTRVGVQSIRPCAGIVPARRRRCACTPVGRSLQHRLHSGNGFAAPTAHTAIAVFTPRLPAHLSHTACRGGPRPAPPGAGAAVSAPCCGAHSSITPLRAVRCRPPVAPRLRFCEAGAARRHTRGSTNSHARLRYASTLLSHRLFLSPFPASSVRAHARCRVGPMQGHLPVRRRPREAETCELRRSEEPHGRQKTQTNGGRNECEVETGEAYRKNPEFQTQKIEKAPRVIVTSARVVRPSREASQQ